MHLRPWLLLYKRRLIASAIACLFTALFTLFLTSADSPWDVGVLWHHFCGCPLGRGDARAVSLPFTFGAFFTAGILSFGVTSARAGTPGIQGFALFLFTRPVPRREQILMPLLIGAVAIAVLPAAAWLVLLGWLKLVQAPALGHLLGAVEMLPAAANLGPHPSFFAVLAALQTGWRLLAAWSVGMSVYAIYASQRWFLLSDSTKLRVLGAFQGVWPAIIPMLTVVSKRALSQIALFPLPGSGLEYLPSPLAISLHLAFAGALLAMCWRILYRIDS